MSSRKKRQSLAEAPYRPHHNPTSLPSTSRRSSRRNTLLIPQSPSTGIDEGGVNESPHDFDKTITTLKSAAESVTVRVWQETADEQARAIQAMRSAIDIKDSRIQKMHRKIGRRDKTIGKLMRRMDRTKMALSKATWPKFEATMGMAMGMGIEDEERLSTLRSKTPASVTGLCTECGENCSRLVKENQQLRDRLYEVDGLCIRLRNECSKLDIKIRGLESN
ncbi:uncharacterized protein EAF01_011360 [Botrytis porri]|uniref:Uncharacterized protein n=1 Tax=Botrytis porri TaxID=87229 RepID=A0A4Z1KNY5_9HELO|nr:uncharacterized protein EAF01_011360 [Botrytis porri]KAF7885295.1 hypothetical protein EAF01_011360 [Botrytis porri]TGO86052.1 hypothetical protein BPOR_0340g00120 [Botrytis porri]